MVAPGVDAEAFSLRPRAASLADVAARLDVDPDTARGRPGHTDELVARALDARDASALDALATTYDQAVPEPEAAARLRTLVTTDAPIVGIPRQLIPQKGVELVLGAQQLLTRDTEALIVGFGGYREWLAALVMALRRGDQDALRWLRETASMPIDSTARPTASDAVTFTGRLDHRYAPDALAAMEVMVVPSILREAFGMVAAEAAAAGALPVVARHSGLAEVAEALESEVRRPGLFSFAPGEGASRTARDEHRAHPLAASARTGRATRGRACVRRPRVDVGADRGEDPRRLVSDDLLRFQQRPLVGERDHELSPRVRVQRRLVVETLHVGRLGAQLVPAEVRLRR